jgi:endoglucanase
VNVVNMGGAPGEWTVTTQVSGTINNLWNAQWTQQGSQLTASGLHWNKTLAPGATAEFGFCAQR